MRRLFQHKKSGFTLVELLMVIAIIGILAALVVVSIMGAQNKAKDTQKKNNGRSLASGLAQYGLDNKDIYPIVTTDGGESIANVSSGTFYTALVTGGYVKPGVLTTNLAAKYNSTGDGTSFTLGYELATPSEAVVTSGNGVYASDAYVAGLYSPASAGKGVANNIASNISFGCQLAGTYNTDYTFTTALSISIWIKPNYVDGNDRTIVQRFSASTGYKLNLSGWYSGRLQFLVNASTVTADAGTAPTANAWHHVVATWTSGQGIIYLDGVKVNASTTASATLTEPAGNPQITVANNSNGHCYSGAVDDLRMYSTVLSQADVNRIYNGGRGTYSSPAETGLQVGFRFDDDPAVTAQKFYSYTTVDVPSAGTKYSLSWTPSATANYQSTGGVTPLGLYGLTTGSLPSNRAYITYGPQ